MKKDGTSYQINTSPTFIVMNLKVRFGNVKGKVSNVKGKVSNVKVRFCSVNYRKHPVSTHKSSCFLMCYKVFSYSERFVPL